MGLFNWLERNDRERNEPERGTGTAPPGGSASDLQDKVVAALQTVYDPEIPVNIYDLGLIYGIDVDPETHAVHVRMTLTAPGCPVAQTFPQTVEDAVRSATDADPVTVELVWEPPWTRERMSEAAQLELGML